MLGLGLALDRSWKRLSLYLGADPRTTLTQTQLRGLHFASVASLGLSPWTRFGWRGDTSGERRTSHMTAATAAFLAFLDDAWVDGRMAPSSFIDEFYEVCFAAAKAAFDGDRCTSTMNLSDRSEEWLTSADADADADSTARASAAYAYALFQAFGSELRLGVANGASASAARALLDNLGLMVVGQRNSGHQRCDLITWREYAAIAQLKGDQTVRTACDLFEMLHGSRIAALDGVRSFPAGLQMTGDDSVDVIPDLASGIHTLGVHMLSTGRVASLLVSGGDAQAALRLAHAEGAFLADCEGRRLITPALHATLLRIGEPYTRVVFGQLLRFRDWEYADAESALRGLLLPSIADSSLPLSDLALRRIRESDAYLGAVRQGRVDDAHEVLRRAGVLDKGVPGLRSAVAAWKPTMARLGVGARFLAWLAARHFTGAWSALEAQSVLRNHPAGEP